MCDIAVMGNRIAGNLAAAYLTRYHPQAKVAIIGPKGEGLPSVGESTVECTVMFMKDIGIFDWLNETQAPKGGLTFYYKLDPSSWDESYWALETPVTLNAVSKQLNRPVLDQFLRERNEERGVAYIPGKVSQVELGTGSEPHRLEVRDEDGPREITARYLIDATGRSRVLGRKLDLVLRPTQNQRSTFWFRLANFDRSLWMRDVKVTKAEHNLYDSYYCTHHFMGPGNWIWCIPLQSNEYDELISIGITWRPDLFKRDIRSVEDLLNYLDKQHPSLAAIVRSGTVVDTATYRDYLYACKQVYGERWYIIGDAARAVDPLYSTGLVFTTLQIRQVSQLIRLEHDRKLTASELKAFNDFIISAQETLQGEVTRHYDIMHDPMQSHIRVQWDTNEYEHFHLPLLARGFHLWPAGVRFLLRNRAICADSGESLVPYAEPNRIWRLRQRLLAAAAHAIGPARAANMIDNYKHVLNYKFDGSDSDRLSRMLAHGFMIRSYLRLRLLHRAHWAGAVEQAGPLLKDACLALLLLLTGERLLPMIQPITIDTRENLKADPDPASEPAPTAVVTTLSGGSARHHLRRVTHE